MRGLLIRVALQTAVAVALLAVNSASYAQVTPGTAIRFNGGNGHVSVPHNAAFNAYPLTVTAWFRTTNAASQGIVSKYFDASGNGWSLITQSGRLRGFYYRGFTTFAVDGMSAASVADGRWHHVALVVDASGGKIFLDGRVVVASAWSGVPGGVTGGESVLIGRYFNASYPFIGDIDEVSIWNQALNTNAVNYVKHRSLSGSEDGLVGYWRFDEGFGAVANDSTAFNRDATLVSGPQWAPSTAPVALSALSGMAARFDGIDDQAVAAHDPSLNALPITLMTWVKTSQSSGNWPTLIAKYIGSSLNGWALSMSQGRLYPWYYASGANNVDAGTFTGPNDRFIADGQWHHVAFTVDTTRGITYIDGRSVHTQAWVGVAGPTTSTDGVRFGTYQGSPLLFNGQLDHASIWNTVLSPSEILQHAHLTPTGAEANLIASYEMNEGTGTVIGDSGGVHNAPGVGFTWVGSLTRIGDGSTHLLANIDRADYARLWDIDDSPAFNGFPIPVTATVRRFHDFGSAPPVANVAATLAGTLTDSALQPVALEAPAQASFTFILPSENANAPATNSVTNLVATLNIDPVQLASVALSHYATVTLEHSENGGAPSVDDTSTLPLVKLLDFSGTLFFGSTETRFSSVANTPFPGLPGGGGINTLLLVNNNSGYLVAKPTHHYGNGGNFVNAILFDDGHAEVTSGTLLVNGPVPDREVLNGITFDRSNVTISPTAGPRATVTLRFPAGFGVATSISNRLAAATWPFVNTPLDDLLIPTAPVLRIEQTVFGVQDTKPIWMETPQLEWSLPTGELTLLSPVTLHFVRQTEDDELAAGRATLVNPSAADRISNDGYWHNASSTTANAIITTDTNGAALLALDADLPATRFRPHFPYSNVTGNEYIESTGGTVLVRDNGVDPFASFMNIAGVVPVPYARDCADKNCSGLTLIGAQVMPFTPNSGQLIFTRDGGLMAYGTVPPQNLTWGYLGGGGNDFAHRTSDVEDGAFHMPGTFLRAVETRADAELRPAVLLFTGAGDATDLSYIERPGQANYYSGFANYAGVNFRAPASGHSILAGIPTGNYPLVPQAKYYARFGGIDGIHQAATFPSRLLLYGYDFTFTRFALSFLDSETHKSLTDGAITFPAQPAGFVQEFQEMKFLCRGGLNEAKVPPGLDPKHLNYWNTDFMPLTLQFRSKTGSTLCNDLDRKLVLGVETKLPFIPEALHAALGFHPDGNLVTAFDAVEGCDSRFPVPARLSLRGPGGSYYKISTASDGYFNNWNVPNRAPAGFYNIAGSMDVFFFEDVKVHLHVTPTSATGSDIAVMGGWRAKDKLGDDLGWKDGAKTFFNTAKFDGMHIGYPAGQTADTYRNSPTPEFHPRAQKDWIEVAKFDYPLLWNKGSRQFSSFEDSLVKLPVIDVNSRMKQLTPGKADIDFSQDLNLKLPRIKALDFVNDAIDEINSVGDSFSNAVRQALGAAADSTGLARGLRGLQHTMRDQMDDFFRPILQPTLDPVVDRMYPLLSEQLRTNAPNFLKNVSNIVASAGVDLKGSIRQINSVAGNPNGVVGKVNNTLTDVDDTVGLLLRIVEKDGSGKRHVVRVLLQKLAEDQGGALGIVADIGDGLANQLLGDLEPTLADLEQQLRDLRNEFATIRGEVSSATGDFKKALDSITQPTTAFDQYQQLAIGAVSNLLATSVTPAGDYFTANRTAATQAIRERLIVAFMASATPAKYQQTFKQFLYDDDALLNTLLDTLCQQINSSIRSALTDQIGAGNDGLFKALKGAGQMASSLGSAKIRGAPTFNGDALKKIRLDAHVKMNLPDELTFSAYMQIVELDSQSVPLGCIPAGAPAAEVRLGARDVPLNWLGLSTVPLTLTVEARWTLQNGSVIGIGGLIEINGEVGFKGCSVKSIGATLAIGEVENYFACKAAGTVIILGVPVDVHVGLFVGDACTLEPLIFVDPDAPKALEDAVGFAGVYLNFGGGVSLSEILFGTSTCFLDVEATINTVLYYQGGAGFGRIGMRQAQKIEAEVLCLISASVEIVLFSTLTVTPSGIELILGGSGEVCGKIGYCPFCIEGCAGITIKGIVNDGGIDYSVDL